MGEHRQAFAVQPQSIYIIFAERLAKVKQNSPQKKRCAQNTKPRSICRNRTDHQQFLSKPTRLNYIREISRLILMRILSRSHFLCLTGMQNV